MNNFRLTTNSKLTAGLALGYAEQASPNLKLENPESLASFNLKVSNLFSLPAPYVIKDGVRYIRGTNNLISSKLGIIAIDECGNKEKYMCISECSRALGFGRLTIKNCLLKGNIHKGYQFVYNA